MRNRVPVFILAGGRSSRFGGDKARALLDGRPLLLHAADQARPVASSITVVADDAGKYDDLGLRTIADEVCGIGPLAGLHRALREVEGDGWLLALPCDLLGLERRWLAALLAARTSGGARAVAYRDRRWEPFPVLLHRELAGVVGLHIACRRHALWQVLEEARALALPLPAGWDGVCQVNTRQSLQAWRRGRHRLRGGALPPAPLGAKTSRW